MVALDHIHAEPEPEVPAEQSPAEDPANTELTLGKPRCIPPRIIVFYFESLLYNKFDYAFSL
jgi:hypothetical protein